MSTRKSAKKAVKKTATKAAKKTVAKKAASKPPAKKTAKKISKPSAARKSTRAPKKKAEATPANVVPLPGKLSRFVDEHGPGVMDTVSKLLREFGPQVAYLALDEAARRYRKPVAKMALGIFRDIARGLAHRREP